MIHEWMGSRHRLLREAAGEHMGSCSLRDLDPRGEVEGLAQLPPASGVRVNPHQSTVNKIFQSTGAEYFTELPPSIAPSLSLSGIGHMARWRSPAALTE